MLGKARGQLNWFWVSAFVMVLLLALPGYCGGRPVVVLDPGHGGEDIGVTGSYGAREKDVTLALALEVKRQLGLLCEVRLTRESDRGLTVMRRTELANSFHGDLLISLHTGGGLSREDNRLALFVQQVKKGRVVAPGGEDDWDGGHRPYIPESQVLAAALKRSLSSLDGYDGVGYSGAPLRVARGVRMPMALLEVGNLTNPREEARLDSSDYLRRVSAAVAAGIETYLSR